MSTILRLENVSFFYNDPACKAIDRLSFDIESGSFVAVLGHNGSGKSTLAKLMNALLLPKEGSVFVKEIDTHDENRLLDIRRTVGMVFQNPDNQIVASVVEDDVAFAPENLGFPPEEIRQRVDKALRRTGMETFRNHAPHRLSGGQKQRVAIAGVLAMQPEILVLDEPTAMLDPSGRKEVLAIIDSLRSEQNVTVILITHHMNECVNADRVFVMDHGHIVMDDGPEIIFSQVEKLQALGLDVPATAETLWLLRCAGWEISENPLHTHACADYIAGLLNNYR